MDRNGCNMVVTSHETWTRCGSFFLDGKYVWPLFILENPVVDDLGVPPFSEPLSMDSTLWMM